MGGKKLPLELVLLDDESDATKTVSRLETLAAQGVAAYLGGFGSDLHAAAARWRRGTRRPYLGVAFALHKIHQQGFRYLFSPFWKSPDIGQRSRPCWRRSRRPSASRAWRSFRRRRIGGPKWRRPGGGGQGGRLRGGGAGRVRARREGFLRLILKAKAANVDTVFGLPTPPDGMTMIKQIKELGYTPKLTFLIRAPDPRSRPRISARMATM